MSEQDDHMNGHWIPVPLWTCVRCGHTWVGRKLGRPVFCPKCMCRNWWKPPGKSGRPRRQPVDVG